MPIVKISILEGRSASDKKKLLDIVHSSLVEAFKIPDNDRCQRICEFKKDHFEFPDYISDKFTIIEMDIYPGRSIEAKKTLYKLLYSEFKNLGYQEKDYLVLLHEHSLDNWGWGGKSAREIDLGFSLDV